MKWLSLVCLTVASKYRTVIMLNFFNFACVLIAKSNQRPSSRRRLFFVSHHTQIQAERGTEQSFILFLFLGEFSLKRLFLAERTATKPLRVKRQIEFRAIPCVSVCFRLFPPVSVCFRLTLPGNCAVHHRDPCPRGSGAVQMQCCSACTPGSKRVRR